MAAETNKQTAPRWPGLPEPPSGDFFSETQWAVLMSLIDAALPSVVPESKLTDKTTERAIPDAEYQAAVKATRTTLAESPDEATLAAYLSEPLSKNPASVHALRRSLAGLPAAGRNQLGTVLSALATRPGALLLTFHVTPVHLQPIKTREAILRSWKTSWIPSIRLLSKMLCLLAQTTHLVTSPLYKTVSGYPDIPHDWVPGKGFDFSFLQFEASSEPVTLETDVVIVGSGCGGGVSAKVLAEAGHRVLVVDKGYHYTPDQLPMPQTEGMYHLYENHGFIGSVDNSINVLAGSCWGGGGTVNWSVAWQTQGYVRREWAEQHGLPFFTTQEFQDSLDRVCKFMGVAPAKHLGHRGQALLDGARKLGWDAKPTPQNCGEREHPCGHCHLGCSSGNKQGPAVSWLPDAGRNGAQFMEGFKADRVLFEEENGEKRATGVVGRWTSRDKNGNTIGPDSERVHREVVIKAKRVIVSSGSLHSPLLLKRSGLKNRHIGRNLHLHPVNYTVGFYDEDVRPWEGGILTSVCTSFENLDNNGHGTKLEPVCMVPYTAMSGLPWLSGKDFKLDAARLRHAAGFISLTRDRDSGSVIPDPDTGEPMIEYTPSAFDAAHTLEGVIALAKVCYITGAREIRAILPGVRPFIRPAGKQSPEDEKLGVQDPAFVAWLAEVRKAGNKPPFAPYSSAHQMGTCRMSSHAGAGVVDAKGKTWEAEGLYVADASVFPSASGVNPMATNMAIADHIARGIAEDLKGAK